MFAAKKMGIRALFVGSLLLIIALCGCTPSDNEAKRVLANMNGGSDLVEVDEFKNVSTQKGTNFFGQQNVAIQYTATLRWPNGEKRHCAYSYSNPASTRCMYAVDRPAGDIQPLRGVIVFDKTPDGWRGQDGHIY